MKIRKVLMLMALMVFMLAGVAMAAGTATLNVSATVLATCSVSGSPGSIDFGSIDPADPGPIAGVVTAPTFTCTNGTNYTIDASANDYTLDDGGGNTMTYTVTEAPLVGVGSGAAVSFVTGASITQAQYGIAPAGAYTDVLTYDITP